MIKLLEGFPENVIALSGTGRVTKQDYFDVVIPTVKAALEKHRRVRLYYELGNEFAGVDASAAWEDFKIGMEHLTRWERMAVVTDTSWIRSALNFFRFFMPGEIKVFSVSEADRAREWIKMTSASAA